MKFSKLISAVVFTFFVFALQLQAQTKLGLIAGANIVTCDCEGLVEPGNSYTGAFGGLTFSQNLKNRWDFAADMLVSEKGFSFQNSGIIGPDKEKGYYIDLIPSIDFKLISKLYLTGGVQFNYKFLDYQYDGKQWNKTSSRNATLKAIDYGLVFGAKIKLEKWLVTARFTKGFAELSNITLTDINGNPIGTGSFKNQSVQLGIGYYFKR